MTEQQGVIVDEIGVFHIPKTLAEKQEQVRTMVLGRSTIVHSL